MTSLVSYLSSMYKQQSPVSVSSAISALLVTIVVLLIAASANAQTTDTISIDPVPTAEVDQNNGAVPPLEESMPTPSNTANQVSPTTSIIKTDLEALPPNTAREAALTSLNQAPASKTLQNSSTISRMQAWREAVKNRKLALEEKRIALQNASTSRQARLGNATQSNITVGVSSITATLNNAITNSLNINARLQSKVTELETRDIDMSAATTLLTEADELLNLAMEALEGISINAQYAVTSDDPLADWAAVRQQFSEVRDLIKRAHEVMREASSIIKSSIRPANNN